LTPDQIARVSVKGLITDDVKFRNLMADIKKTDSVRAVILHINSPGGTTTGGEALFASIRDVSSVKPVVAVFGTVATSAAYLIGIASDYVISRGNTITGSIGVIVQWAEVTDLLGKIGVKMESVKSGSLKAAPSPFEPTTEEARKVTLELVEESQKWFNDLVVERRKIAPDVLANLTSGRIFTGRQALKLKLIDKIGGEEAAVKWLETNKGLAENMNIVNWRAESSGPLGIFSSLNNIRNILSGLKLEKLANFVKLQEKFDILQLDGLISVWHPS
jgi:protease-4